MGLTSSLLPLRAPRESVLLWVGRLLQPSLGVRSWEPGIGVFCVPSEAYLTESGPLLSPTMEAGAPFSPLFHSSAVQWLWALASSRARLGQQLPPYWEGWAHCLPPLLSFCFLWEVKMIIVALYEGWDNKDHTDEENPGPWACHTSFSQPVSQRL